MVGVRKWKRLTDADLQALEAAIAKAPGEPPVVKGAGGLRKIRFAPPSQHVGKRGSMRVGFAYYQMKAVIFVVVVFSKHESSNSAVAERKEIAAELGQAERNFR